MLDKIFELCNGNFDMIAICVYDKELYAVPCEETVSGIYPDYKQRIKISNFLVAEYLLNDNDAILITNREGVLEVYYAEDSWDGYQIIWDKESLG